MPQSSTTQKPQNHRISPDSSETKAEAELPRCHDTVTPTPGQEQLCSRELQLTPGCSTVHPAVHTACLHIHPSVRPSHLTPPPGPELEPPTIPGRAVWAPPEWTSSAGSGSGRAAAASAGTQPSPSPRRACNSQRLSRATTTATTTHTEPCPQGPQLHHSEQPQGWGLHHLFPPQLETSGW